MTEIHTVIIGAGQAGLSVGRYLKKCNIPFIILEKESRIGTSWRNRYDSLLLDSFAKYSKLEGFPFTGDQARRPKKDEVADYLESFATHFDLHPHFNTEIYTVTKEGETFITTTSNGTYASRTVVVATGPFQTPFIPDIAKKLPPDIYQLHAKHYKNPSMLPSGTVLVVGGGNSGSEIAKELIDTGRSVIFSYKGKLKSIESSRFSQWIAYSLGVAHISQTSLLGRLVRWYTKGKSVGMDIGALIKSKNVSLIGELGNVERDEICSAKGISFPMPSSVVWATGYRDDFSIIDIPEFDYSTQKRGVTNIDGLYILTIRWQYSKSSSHLAGISRDAKYIAKAIAQNIANT